MIAVVSNFLSAKVGEKISFAGDFPNKLSKKTIWTFTSG
jgi:hypothetical protein